MGLFGRKQKMNNAAAGTLPPGTRPILQPGPTTIHNHGTNWFSVIGSAFLCGIIALMLSWFALRFLLSQIGSINPNRDAAYVVIYGAGLFGFVWLVSWRIGPLLDSLLGFLLEVEQEKTRRETIRLQATQSTIDPGRMNEEDYKFARVILAVMMIAYQWRENSGRSAFPGKWRPWSLDSSLETANNIGIKLTRTKANEVSKWLYKQGVITAPDGGQITTKYPDLGSVRVMLDREYGRPIQVVLSPAADNGGYVHID